MQEASIGVFDSGAGGLTVAKEIIDLLPSENTIYLGDTARFPYGPRNPGELERFVFEIINFLTREQVKLIVIACNSSSAAGLRAARERFDVPIIGVIEPGARGAVAATRNGRIGVIGTAATIGSQAYARAVGRLDPDIKVFSEVCGPFADLVERGETHGTAVATQVHPYLQPMIEAGVDTLVLGCTHYPLLEDVIGEIMGDTVRLISSAHEVALEVRSLLEVRTLLNLPNREPRRRFLSTNTNHKFEDLGRRFLGAELPEVETVQLTK
ncbi:MAG: glutamate racemase [Terriglobia bacterium]